MGVAILPASTRKSIDEPVVAPGTTLASLVRRPSVGLQQRRAAPIVRRIEARGDIMKAFKLGLLCFLMLLMRVPDDVRGQGRGGATQRDLLYVAVPGRVNDIGYGGIGILVFDANKNFRFVKRIPTWITQPALRQKM